MGTPTLRAAAGLLVVAALTVVAAVPVQSADVDPEALRLLRRMADYLSALQQFSVDTQNTLEAVLDSGQKIQYDIAASTMVKRPKAQGTLALIRREKSGAWSAAWATALMWPRRFNSAKERLRSKRPMS
jgi:hypothetical protein